MSHTFDIQRKDGNHWHGDIGESRAWPTLDDAMRAVDSLAQLGAEWDGAYRIVETTSGCVALHVTIGSPTTAVRS